MNTGKSPGGRKVWLELWEWVACVAILSFWIALLVPAVDAARDREGGPPIWPLVAPFYRAHPWLFILTFPLVTTSAFGCLLLALRAVLPAGIRAHFPWRKPPEPERPAPVPRNDSRPALWSTALAAAASAILVFAASHVRADRSQRRPVVTWEGIAAPYVEYLAYLGWGLSVLAFVLAVYALERCVSRWNRLAHVGITLAALNFMASLMFWAAVYED